MIKKKLHRLLPVLMTLMLTGCAGSGQNQSTEPTEGTSPPTQETAATTSEREVFRPTSLPVIAIETVRQDANVLDFVTKPVAKHVSEQIASWTPGYVIPPAPYYEDCTVTVMQPGETDMPTACNAQVKVRGNWTTNYAKKPLRIKFAEKQPMLGMNDSSMQKNWVLLAEYKDASFLRDHAILGIADELLEQDGLYVTDTTLAEVTVNGQYWGVYLVAEQQEVGKDRVDISKVKKDDQGTDVGYLLEFDGYYYIEEPLQAFYVDYADNAPLKPYDGEGGSGKTMRCLPEDDDEYKKEIGITIKSDINSQEQHDFIAGFVKNTYRILYAAAYENKAMAFDSSYSQISESSTMTPQQAVEAVVDVNSLADAYIINEIACDADIYWSSFYMSADFGEKGDKKLRFEAPWDFDSGLGNKDRCADGTGFYAANIVPDVNGTDYETINPWLAVLMYQEWFQDIIREKWSAAYDGNVFQRAIDAVRTDSQKYADAFLRDAEKWGISTKDKDVVSELCRGAAKCKTQSDAAEYLADWLEKRIAFLNSKWHK